MKPPPPTDEEQAAAALENSGINLDSDVTRRITGVHRDTPGVDSNLFPTVTPRQERAVRRNEMTHRPNVIPPPRDEGINPPPLLTRVEVEDVEHDDEDNDTDKNVESVNAPSTNLGGGPGIDETTTAN